jgi:uncharacterized protein YeaO (DUF488 family)
MTHELPASHVRLRRAYEPAAPDDGVRVLPERHKPVTLSNSSGRGPGPWGGGH